MSNLPCGNFVFLGVFIFYYLFIFWYFGRNLTSHIPTAHVLSIYNYLICSYFLPSKLIVQGHMLVQITHFLQIKFSLVGIYLLDIIQVRLSVPFYITVVSLLLIVLEQLRPTCVNVQDLVGQATPIDASAGPHNPTFVPPLQQSRVDKLF